MARHAQAREIAEIKGATKVNPERYRNEPPKSGYDLGDPPEDLEDDAKKAWFEISTYAPQGILSGSDRILIEAVSSLIAEFRSDRKGFPATKYTHLIGGLARLGMSVADRQKLSIEKPGDENAFNAF